MTDERESDTVPCYLIPKELLEACGLGDHQVTGFTITAQLSSFVKVEAEILLTNGDIGRITKVLQQTTPITLEE